MAKENENANPLEDSKPKFKPVVEKENVSTSEKESIDIEAIKKENSELKNSLNSMQDNFKRLEEMLVNKQSITPASKITVKQDNVPFGIEKEMDDFMENPVTFYSSRLIHLSAYNKYRTVYISPNNTMIKFEEMSVDIKKDEKSENLIILSKYVTFSKAVADFIRNAPEFGFTIFEELAHLDTKLDTVTADQISRIASQVDALNKDKLYAMAIQEYNLNPIEFTDEKTLRDKIKTFEISKYISSIE